MSCMSGLPPVHTRRYFVLLCATPMSSDTAYTTCSLLHDCRSCRSATAAARDHATRTGTSPADAIWLPHRHHDTPATSGIHVPRVHTRAPGRVRGLARGQVAQTRRADTAVSGPVRCGLAACRPRHRPTRPETPHLRERESAARRTPTPRSSARSSPTCARSTRHDAHPPDMRASARSAC